MTALTQRGFITERLVITERRKRGGREVRYGTTRHVLVLTIVYMVKAQSKTTTTSC